MGEGEMRAYIRDALRTLNSTAEAAIKLELAEPFDLGHSERLQFEICPHFYGVKLIQTEEEILPDNAIFDAIPVQIREAAAAADLDLYTAVEEEFLPWFAERWEAVGGPNHYRPAYTFFHGGLYMPRYDLEQRRWCEVEEVWPE
jgi:hypothetical protein